MKMLEINDFTGYLVADNGKIYTTIAQGCRNRYDLSKRIAPREITAHRLPNGYTRVYLRRDSTNKREDVYIHRLVAEYFVPNPDNKPVVNHKNCIRDDNRAENLEWVTIEENVEYALTYGYMDRDKYGKFTHK